MHPETVEVFLTCPYCAETISMIVDTSAGSQHYVEDCEVCCRPIDVRIVCDGHRLEHVEGNRLD